MKQSIAMFLILAGTSFAAMTTTGNIIKAAPAAQTADTATKSFVDYTSLESDMITAIQDLIQKLKLTLAAPNQDSGTSYEIPEAVIRSGKYLAFDPNGNPTASGSAFGKSLMESADAAAARSTLALGDAAVYGVKDEDDMLSNSSTHLPTQQSVKTYVDTVAIYKVPIGTVVPFASSTPPSGWLVCDGRSIGLSGGNADINSDDYTALKALFTADSNKYGVDSSGNPKLPDMQGRVPVGIGTGDASDATAHSLGDKKGTETHTLSIGEMPAHNHGIRRRTGATGGTTVFEVVGATNYDTNTINVTPAGNNQAHNNIQPSLALNYIIKY